MSLKENYIGFREELRLRAKHIHTIFSINDKCDILDYHLTVGRSNSKIRISQWSEFDYIDGKRIEKLKESAYLQLDYYEEWGEHEEHMSIEIPVEMISSDYTDEMILDWWKNNSLKEFRRKKLGEINELYYSIRKNKDIARFILENCDLESFNCDIPGYSESQGNKILDEFEAIWQIDPDLDQNFDQEI